VVDLDVADHISGRGDVHRRLVEHPRALCVDLLQPVPWAPPCKDGNVIVQFAEDVAQAVEILRPPITDHREPRLAQQLAGGEHETDAGRILQRCARVETRRSRSA
jgi:hypothetical protein